MSGPDQSLSEAMKQGIDFNLKAYVCIHVFDRERPVLLVSRPQGDWCFLCGDGHEDNASSYRVVGIGHVLQQDATLDAVLDLEPEWEAERSATDQPWFREPIAEDE